MVQDLIEAVATLEPKPDAIGSLAARLLAALQEPDSGAQLSASAGYFVEELNRLLLDWIGTGEIDRVEGLLESLQAALSGCGGLMEALDGIASDARLAARLAGIVDLLAAFLRVENLAKPLGALSGRRRERWRPALLWIGRKYRPVRASELLEEEFFADVGSATYALNGLADLGLILRKEEGPKKVLFEISWHGRRVCRRLDETDPDVKPVAPPIARLLVFPEGQGMSTPEMGREVGLDSLGLRSAVAQLPGLTRWASAR